MAHKDFLGIKPLGADYKNLFSFRWHRLHSTCGERPNTISDFLRAEMEGVQARLITTTESRDGQEGGYPVVNRETLQALFDDMCNCGFVDSHAPEVKARDNEPSEISLSDLRIIDFNVETKPMEMGVVKLTLGFKGWNALLSMTKDGNQHFPKLCMEKRKPYKF